MAILVKGEDIIILHFNAIALRMTDQLYNLQIICTQQKLRIKIRNRSGSKFDLCGTPEVGIKDFEAELLSLTN